MLSNYFKCRKDTESKNIMNAKKNKWKLILLSKCTVCNIEILRFI